MSDLRTALCLWTCALLAGCCSSSPESLNDPDPDVRREALACLADDEPSEAVKLAGELIASGREPDPALRATALRVLGELQGSKYADSVASLLVGSAGGARDRNAQVRQQAAATLGQLKQGGAALVTSVRDDPDPDVRWSAADAIARGEHRTPQALEALITALDDAAQPVRLTARRSLRTLTEADHGANASTWRAWLQEQALQADQEGGEDEVYEDEVYEDEVYEDEVYEDEVYEDDPPAEDAPPEDPPAEDAPAEDPPAEDAPADAPAEDPPAEDAPAEDAPAEDPPAEDAPETPPDGGEGPR